MKTYLMFAAALILAFATSATVAGPFEDGLSSYGTGDFKTAFAQWRPIAQTGDASAQYYLGQMYYKGQGTQKDLKMAYAWLSVASKGGMDLATDLMDDIREEMTTAQIDEAITMSNGLATR